MRRQPRSRALASAAAIAAVISTVVALGVGTSTLFRPALAELACGAINRLVFEHAVFGRGGHVRLSPRASAAPATAVAHDADAALSVEGYPGEISLALNLRREIFVPTFILFGVVAAAPLGLRRKGLCLALGGAATFAIGTLFVYLLVAWAFVRQLRGIYPPDSARPFLLDLVHHTLLSPPSPRFVLPAIIAVLLVSWQRARPRQPVVALADRVQIPLVDSSMR